jgi:hypothetical protein
VNNYREESSCTLTEQTSRVPLHMVGGPDVPFSGSTRDPLALASVCLSACLSCRASGKFALWLRNMQPLSTICKLAPPKLPPKTALGTACQRVCACERWRGRSRRAAAGVLTASEAQSDLTLAPTSNAAAAVAARHRMLPLTMRQRQRFRQSRGLATTGLTARRRSSLGGTSGRTGSNGTASSLSRQTHATA